MKIRLSAYFLVTSSTPEKNAFQNIDSQGAPHMVQYRESAPFLPQACCGTAASIPCISNLPCINILSSCMPRYIVLAVVPWHACGRKGADFLHWTIWLPFEITILKSGFLHARKDQKYAQGQIFVNLGPQMADISMDNQRANFNTGPYEDPLPP